MALVQGCGARLNDDMCAHAHFWRHVEWRAPTKVGHVRGVGVQAVGQPKVRQLDDDAAACRVSLEEDVAGRQVCVQDSSQRSCAPPRHREEVSEPLPALPAAPPWMMPRPWRYSSPHATWCSSDRTVVCTRTGRGHGQAAVHHT